MTTYSRVAHRSKRFGIDHALFATLTLWMALCSYVSYEDVPFASGVYAAFTIAVIGWWSREAREHRRTVEKFNREADLINEVADYLNEVEARRQQRGEA